MVLPLAALLPLVASAQSTPDSRPEALLVSRGVFEGKTARPLRYQPDGADFVIENGPEFFNRPLYCRNTACRVDGGDKPEFSLYLPGRGGNLRPGIRNASGLKWLNDAERIVTRYRPGSLIYHIRDGLLGNGTIELIILPLNATKGCIARAELRDTDQPIEFIWAFGGANGMRGSRAGDIGCEREPVRRFFQLRPDQCAGHTFDTDTNGFLLHSRHADIAGRCSAPATWTTGNAAHWNNLTALLSSTGAETNLPVAIGVMTLRPAEPRYLALEVLPAGQNAAGKPPTIESAGLSNLFAAAEQRRASIAQRVIVETPDPFINAAAAAINVAADGIWDEAQGAYMHGAVAWRNKLLGWRGPYAGDALGWHDRARRHFTYWAGRQNTDPIPNAIPPADPAVNLSRNEPALHSNGALSHSHYDMNLVYIDALFRHLRWTGDLEFAREVWPVIERHLAWEQRLFRREFGPDKLPLYEAYAAIWASDDMAYHGGGAAHTSAYNYWHNKMAARLARLLGQDPAPYDREAGLIARAMRELLWVEDRGCFAEWKDYLGLQLVHPEAGAWTVYHTIDSEAGDPLEAWRMTQYLDATLPRIPVHGPGVPAGDWHTIPTTRWMPYTWSLNNVVMAEVAHSSLAYWQAGRPEDAFRLFKGCVLDSMFLGLCPGNVGMTTFFDMARGEAQRDFADAVGVASRTIVEGLFGIRPDALAGELWITPGFPNEWESATIRHPDVQLRYRREGSTDRYDLKTAFAKPLKLRLQVPARRVECTVSVNGQPARWEPVDNSVGAPRIAIACEPARETSVLIEWNGEAPIVLRPPTMTMSTVGLTIEPHAADRIGSIVDPSGALIGSARHGRGPVHFPSPLPLTFAKVSERQTRTIIVNLQQGNLTWSVPLALDLRPQFEIVPAGTSKNSPPRFRVRNNTPANENTMSIHIAGRQMKERLPLPAFGESPDIAIPADGLLPGSIPVIVSLGADRGVRRTLVNWHLQAAAQTRFEPVQLDRFFNDRVTQIFRNGYLSPRSPFCSLALPKQGIGSWCSPNTTFDVDDTGLRQASAAGNGRITVQGIPFVTPADAARSNIVFTSQWDNYPRQAVIPLKGRASKVYLLMAGSSNPMQSRFDNGEVLVTYRDGTTDRLALHNPTTWWLIDQDYFIDDYAFRRPDPIPPRVDLKTGQVRILDADSFKGRGGKVAGGAATVLDLPLDRAKALRSLTVNALANEVVIGVMAVTLAR